MHLSHRLLNSCPPPTGLHLLRKQCLRRCINPGRASSCGRLASKKDNPEDGTGEDGDTTPGEKVDIDQLAQRLSEEAGRLRKRKEEQDETASEVSREMQEEGSREVWEEDVSRFNPQGRDIEAALLADIGEGGFCADEFELVQKLGHLSIQMFRQRGSILENSQVATEREAVIAFAARYYSGRPYEFPVTTLLKEYLPSAEGVAGNELMIMKELCGLPKAKAKWEILQNPNPDPPVVRLLGYFLAAPSESAAKVTVDPEEVAITDAKGRSIWLVYQWEKTKPLSGFWTFDQVETSPTWPWQKPKESSLDLRRKMLRHIAQGIVQALSFCHSRAVAHGSLGSGSVLLSTYDARDAPDLMVKLDNFGFARHISPSNANDEGTEQNSPGVGGFSNKNLSAGFEKDLKATGLLLLEAIVMSLTDKSNVQNISKEGIERLVNDVFRDDFEGLREYCTNEPDWEEAVQFLEESDAAGWNLLRSLLRGEDSIDTLVEHPFFKQ